MKQLATMNYYKFIFTLLALSMNLSFCLSIDNSTDKTMTEGAKGRDVVEAVINKIKSSGIFPDDHGYLFRVAYVQTLFGENSPTFIWIFVRVIRDQKLEPFYAKIKQHFGIDWNKVQLNDLRKPLINGLAEYLFLMMQTRIPETIEEQAQLCLNREACQSIKEFISKVKILETLSNSTTTPRIPLSTRGPTPSDGLLEIESKARDIASNAINKLRDNYEISNYLCTELSQLYTKEQWICIVGQKPFPSVSVAEHQNTKSKFEFEFSLGITHFYIIVNIH
jgi:hypothetical protein